MKSKEVRDGRSIPRETLEQYRFQAIKLREKGWKIEDIAEAFGLVRTSVSHWFMKLDRHGLKSLKRTKAKGKEPKLTKEDKTKILSWLKQSAVDFGFETPLWTGNRVQQLIKKQLDKSLHVSNVREWLKRWNLTNQKPERRATQQDERAVKRWLKEEWPKIREHRRRWQAMLYFMDESGVSLTAVMGKTWAPKGKTPVVKTTGNRGGLCVTSAISPAGKMTFRIEKGKVNAGRHIEFLIQIMKQHPNRKIIVIEDNAPSHIAYAVKSFVASQPNKIAVYYLPSYSPELNPDEHVWAYLKAHQLKSHQAQTTSELKHLVKRKMQGIQRKNGLVNSFGTTALLGQDLKGK